MVVYEERKSFGYSNHFMPGVISSLIVFTSGSAVRVIYTLLSVPGSGCVTPRTEDQPEPIGRRSDLAFLNCDFVSAISISGDLRFWS